MLAKLKALLDNLIADATGTARRDLEKLKAAAVEAETELEAAVTTAEPTVKAGVEAAVQKLEAVVASIVGGA